MHLEPLTAVSPIDGRYRSQLSSSELGDNFPRLDEYFSEYALIKYRVWVEVEYLLMLADHGLVQFLDADRENLLSLYRNFSLDDAKAVKAHERVTNHDVKAVEYFIKDRMDAWGLHEQREWVHFGLTSQDVNNTAVPMSWMHALKQEMIPQLHELVATIRELGVAWISIPMLARTHGQPASPTRLGKEMLVFVERLGKQLAVLESLPTSGKFGGATGNFNAHHVAFPQIDWIDFGNQFLSSRLGLQRQQFTTQIEHYDDLAAQMDCLKRIGTILIDFCRDIWTYVSMDYFKQKIKAGEVGSSAMPHKVNPIDFENAEGNLGIANALWEHLAAKLPISRLQRDLTDSTVLRNIGVPFAHLILSLRSIKRGLGKLVLNEGQLEQDLQKNWIVIAEAIQTILRREKVPNPYEALKELTRGNHAVDQDTFNRFIDGLGVSDEIKSQLKSITPYNYTGISPEAGL
ncbi:adenylosuccinate lyase [Pirellulaceae bacterium SH449]